VNINELIQATDAKKFLREEYAEEYRALQPIKMYETLLKNRQGDSITTEETNKMSLYRQLLKWESLDEEGTADYAYEVDDEELERQKKKYVKNKKREDEIEDEEELKQKEKERKRRELLDYEEEFDIPASPEVVKKASDKETDVMRIHYGIEDRSKKGQGLSVKSIDRIDDWTKYGFIVRHELIDGKGYGGGDTLMKTAYNLEGQYIGDESTARFLCKKRGIYPELATKSHGVCSIGYDSKKDGYAGWSHRAIYTFKPGHKITKGSVIASKRFPPGYRLKSMDDAKQAAIAFARGVA
jgi:hypothetical protein